MKFRAPKQREDTEGKIVSGFIERRALSFTIMSSVDGDDEQVFLALQNLSRPDFSLYFFDCEGGSYEAAGIVDDVSGLVGAAIDFMVSHMEYQREQLYLLG